MNSFVHGTGRARQFTYDFIQAGKPGFDKVTKLTHPLYGSVIAESIREDEDGFAQTGYPLTKRKPQRL